MKFVVYGADRRVGLLRDGVIADVAGMTAKFLKEKRGEALPVRMAEALTPSCLDAFIEAGDRALDTTREAEAYLFGAAGDRHGVDAETIVHDAAAQKLHAPKHSRGRVAFCGGNFPAHSAAMAVNQRGAAAAPTGDLRAHSRARGFWGAWKIDRDPQGPEGRVRYPNGVTRFDYEGELAIVLGKPIKNVKPEAARAAIWGVTLFTDWSARDFVEPQATLNFGRRKNFDECYSVGPCIVVGELDAYNVDIETFVNGQRRQAFNTTDMAFTFGEFLEYLCFGLTLYPGDMLASGTGPGTAMDSSKKAADGSIPNDLFLRPGDVVEVKSPRIGVLRSTILPADPA